MIILLIITIILVVLSFIFDKNKTIKGLKIALQNFKKIIIPLLLLVVLVAVILFLIPEKLITEYLANGNRYLSTLLASLFGSITMMPGFIAFPLSGLLKDKGVTYMVISAFTTTLMMVGVLTFPVERVYFGVRVALIRNVLSFFIAIIVALATGLVFGELFL